MGYELHITRKKEWYDEGSDISLAEWKTYVQRDPEMKPDMADANENGCAIWSAGSKSKRAYGVPFYMHSSGNIVVKNPDREIAVKMHQIASELAAKVQGDDGEFYDRDGNPEGSARSGFRWKVIATLFTSLLAIGFFLLEIPAAFALIFPVIVLILSASVIFVTFIIKGHKGVGRIFRSFK